MNYLESFRFWRDNSFFDEEIRLELSRLDEVKDAQEIEDRFCKELEFGTAGLRAVMGAGTNRLNKYVIAKATAGYAIYLTKKYNAECLKNRGVVVCYDTRNNSRFFAEVASQVFSGYGIAVMLFENPRPIPVLSFSIKKFKAVGGVMITASHNTKEYNGYKVYDEIGCQLGIDESNEVTNCIRQINSFDEIDFLGKNELISQIDTTSEFVDKILTTSKFENKKAKKNFKIVYTSLYGTGLVPVTMALEKDGFSSVILVDEQSEPNGNFPTVISPNPGDIHALELGILKAGKCGADIVVGTDPDSDRVGVAVFHNGKFEHLTGNQIGVILADFILQSLDKEKIKKPAIIKSVVSSNFSLSLAKDYGASVFETLTGFKFIGRLVQEFETAKFEHKQKYDYDFLLGYEESYGFLTNTFVRDKDAVGSAMLICEYGAKLKANGKTLIDRLNELYLKYGYCLDEQEDINLCGGQRLQNFSDIMKSLRESNFSFNGKAKVVDFINGKKLDDSFSELPSSNVILYKFEDNSFVAVRPSGTEPKIKLYYSVFGKDFDDAKLKKQSYEKMLKEIIKV